MVRYLVGVLGVDVILDGVHTTLTEVMRGNLDQVRDLGLEKQDVQVSNDVLRFCNERDCY